MLQTTVDGDPMQPPSTEQAAPMDGGCLPPPSDDSAAPIAPEVSETHQSLVTTTTMDVDAGEGREASNTKRTMSLLRIPANEIMTRDEALAAAASEGIVLREAASASGYVGVYMSGKHTWQVVTSQGRQRTSHGQYPSRFAAALVHARITQASGSREDHDDSLTRRARAARMPPDAAAAHSIAVGSSASSTPDNISAALLSKWVRLHLEADEISELAGDALRNAVSASATLATSMCPCC